LSLEKSGEAMETYKYDPWSLNRSWTGLELVLEGSLVFLNDIFSVTGFSEGVV